MKRKASGLWVPEGCESERLLLAKRNKHPKDDEIAFMVEGHRYYLCGNSPEATELRSKNLISVTALIHSFSGHFNEVEQSQKMVASYGFPNKNARHAQYVEVVKGQPKAKWAALIRLKWQQDRDEAAELGTAMHKALELHANEAGPSAPPLSPELQQAYSYLEFKSQQGYDVYRTEMLVFSESLKLCGSIDLLLRHRDDAQTDRKRVVVADWKRSKQLKGISEFGSMTGPLSGFSDCNMVHYTLQLNVYSWLLLHEYSFEVVNMEVICCHPTQANFLKVAIEDQQDAVHVMLEERKSQLMLAL